MGTMNSSRDTGSIPSLSSKPTPSLRPSSARPSARPFTLACDSGSNSDSS
ncbi:hypothetical protein MtrunA17_Chr6g0457441 [Medicago truncatula]|uniref:Uncharacterized protein n=1 Tax=Medicago truncatula TaxID=3880 RepID=A0A396HAT9_MEDTR|nr:hypothetical protein MtrunA17_Chr6g0457441 [Medicago truncatula]